MYGTYPSVIERQNEADKILSKKYDLFCEAQNKLGELYRTDPLLSSILNKANNMEMEEEERYKFLWSKKDNLFKSDIYEESLVLVDEMDKARLDYYRYLFSYMKMIDDDRKMMFPAEYRKRMDELADKGYLLYYLQTPDYSLGFLNEEHWEMNFVEQFSTDIDITFSEILRVGLNTSNELQRKKTKALNNAIAFLKNQQYDSCAKELFPLLENDYNNADNVRNARRRKGFEKEKNIKDKVTDLGYEYFINAFDKISNFYKAVTVNTDKWDKQEVNRNALMHGIYDRETTKKDCVKLFTLFLSFKEITHYIQRIDSLREYFKIVEVVIKQNRNAKQGK